MKKTNLIWTTALSVTVLCALAGSVAFGNGGPFVLKYPNGDPAAKGVLARLDPDLRPGRETRLQVTKEELKMVFDKDRTPRGKSTTPPLVNVIAEYTITNPTDEEIEVDFGFPILRGIYTHPYSMMPRPEVNVRMDEKQLRCNIISNSIIYGIIRQRGREVIERGIDGDAELKRLVVALRDAKPESRESEREKLISYLTNMKKWSDRDAVLMAEYSVLDFGQPRSHPMDRGHMFGMMGPDAGFHKLMSDNLGPLAAIGEQKTTQFFAQLAGCFEPAAAAAYEDIFKAWGGDVRECAVDFETGKIRPRELTIENVDKQTLAMHGRIDPTIYARVDYLNPNAKISEAEKASCKAILKNLPVIFTFAPMNILHYRAKFDAKSIHKLAVSYKQYAFSDTAEPSTYQLAYVVHPASLWEHFGPIYLQVSVPEHVGVRGSIEWGNVQPIRKELKSGMTDIYTTTVKDKTGEIYLAVDAESWKKHLASNNKAQQVAQRPGGSKH